MQPARCHFWMRKVALWWHISRAFQILRSAFCSRICSTGSDVARSFSAAGINTWALTPLESQGVGLFSDMSNVRFWVHDAAQIHSRMLSDTREKAVESLECGQSLLSHADHIEQKKGIPPGLSRCRPFHHLWAQKTTMRTLSAERPG
ncbi:hypothetical protein DFH07DRAFT_50387 [Mycena maculata]|uniref:Uncharacterized protein n=1 Tax=Mycena maculata TaxID=230809 RepID=A0AAD7N188_9AGAR|nr:hypothetical protein DFH07DRAFT_50387 [Mycena maculata]